ncbi:hypothetical protein LSH36_793g01245 [Paralvinella palmiformis]|uniref:Dihydrolipoamide acetyltransferase component of pyruvate dehydrogenase complex n=1 Tax=Paralvinella palmiformis TaxID=53620 RepID=A0AAD9J140_9ANNE|nr:hypothetical protein LSH36_793g01245 [Paralvinella palmiformis]
MVALSPTMEEGVILAWNKKEGDTIVSGDVLCEVETDKTSMEYESNQEGVLLKILRPEGDSAQVGDAIGVIGKKGENITKFLQTISQEQEASVHEASLKDKQNDSMKTDIERKPDTDKLIKASPLARKIAVDKGVSLSNIKGSGPAGRITKKDVEATQQYTVKSVAGIDKDISLESVRKIIAKRLSESKFNSPHYYVTLSVDMSRVLAARTEVNKSHDKKVGVNAFLIKMVAEALRKHPQVNASWRETFIRQFGSVDIGLAVDRGNGLITPVVRDCVSKGIVVIDKELKTLIEKAGENTLLPEEYSGATFTISNLGSFGIEEFTAIINPPGSAILAIGKTVFTPMCDEQRNVVVRPMMKMTLSSDHRVIDGVLAARFMTSLKAIMEDPIYVLL